MSKVMMPASIVAASRNNLKPSFMNSIFTQDKAYTPMFAGTKAEIELSNVEEGGRTG